VLDKMYWVCSDVLTLATQLSTARDLPSPDVLQRRIESLFDQMLRKAHEAGIMESDAQEAKYALVAFVDEQIFRSPWPGRQQWMSKPLQLGYYNENTAGEGFFHHMDALSRDPTRAHVLEIYYLCLALGFQGIYAVRNDGDGLNSVTERAGVQLARALPQSDTFSPHGQPPDGGKRGGKSDVPIVTLGLVALGIALIAFVSLKLILSSSADSAVNGMKDVAKQQSSQKAGK
jgi:type VI secretion system protein ImpK